MGMTAKEFLEIAEDMAPALRLLSTATKGQNMRASIRIDSDGFVSAIFHGWEDGTDGFTIYGYGTQSDGDRSTMDGVNGNSMDAHWIPMLSIGRNGDVSEG